MSAVQAVFSVRITNYDVVLRRSPLVARDQESPVIRVFGTTPRGQRCCLHIHGFYPFMLVEIPKKAIEEDSFNAQRWLRRFRASCERALLLADLHSRRSDGGNFQNKKKDGDRKYLDSVSLVKAFNFYGFDAVPRHLALVRLSVPASVLKLRTLLQSGAIMGMSMRPFEAHIPYFLQFLTVHKLVGMGYLHASNIRFRRPLPRGSSIEAQRAGLIQNSLQSPEKGRIKYGPSQECEPAQTLWVFESIEGLERLWDSDDKDVRKETSMDIEGDILASEILQSHDIKESANGSPQLVRSLQGVQADLRRHRQEFGLPREIESSQDTVRKRTDGEEEAELRQRALQALSAAGVSMSKDAVEIKSDNRVENANALKGAFAACVDRQFMESKLHVMDTFGDLPFWSLSENGPELLEEWRRYLPHEQIVAVDVVSRSATIEQREEAGLVMVDEDRVVECTQLHEAFEEDDLSFFESLFMSAEDCDDASLEAVPHEHKVTDPINDVEVNDLSTLLSEKDKADIMLSQAALEEIYQVGDHGAHELPESSLQSDGAQDSEQSTKSASFLRLHRNRWKRQKTDTNLFGYPPIPDRALSTKAAVNDDTVDESDSSLRERESRMVRDGKTIAKPSSSSSLLQHQIKNEEKEDFTDTGEALNTICGRGLDAAAVEEVNSEIPMTAVASRYIETRSVVCNESKVDNQASPSTIFKDPPFLKTVKDQGGRNTLETCAEQLAVSATESSPTALLQADLNASRTILDRTVRWKPLKDPPTSSELIDSLRDHGLDRMAYRQAFYSRQQDAPRGRVYIGGRDFSFSSSRSIRQLPKFQSSHWSSPANLAPKHKAVRMRPAFVPPHPLGHSVRSFLKELEKTSGDQPTSVLLVAADGHHKRRNEQLPGSQLDHVDYLTPLSDESERDQTRQDANEYRPPSPKYNEMFLGTVPSYALASGPSIGETANINDRARSISRLNAFKSPVAVNKNEKFGLITPQKNYDRQSALSCTTKSSGGVQGSFRHGGITNENDHIRCLCIEVLCATKGTMRPNPTDDSISAIFFCLHTMDVENQCIGYLYVDESLRSDCILDNLPKERKRWSSTSFFDGRPAGFSFYRGISRGTPFASEVELVLAFANGIRQWDPDILCGYDVQRRSVGLLYQRVLELEAKTGLPIWSTLSRENLERKMFDFLKRQLTPQDDTEGEEDSKKSAETRNEKELLQSSSQADFVAEALGLEDVKSGEAAASYIMRKNTDVRVTGRIVLSIWRILRGEIALRLYSLQNVASVILNRRLPFYHDQALTEMWNSKKGRGVAVSYLVRSLFVETTSCLLEKLDIIHRTSEFARVFGIDFYSVLTRGSQFRVESMMSRLAHAFRYVLPSPSRSEVASQRGMETIPLVLEPESAMYTSPIVVLDFQSLYPSMMIAYNLCYSTCLGVLPGFRRNAMEKKLGVIDYDPHYEIIEKAIAHDQVYISPNGVVFASPFLRTGILPQLLREILDCRVAIKKTMKDLGKRLNVRDSELNEHTRSLMRSYLKTLEARQMGLKLIANVTYGYTAAGFSGRMPCAELADAIVASGRQTLERAIAFVENNQDWRARVVYGDTDSLFVHLPGRSREEAFAIGEEIAAEVSKMNPEPVKLKLEKVYQPCFLIAKKRYVGFAYESPSQSKPIFDAKGIETVRRDGCPIVSRMMERSLRLMFKTKDLSILRKYLLRQWDDILKDNVNIADFIFAKEVRLGSYSPNLKVLPPSALIAQRQKERDQMSEALYGERVPFVVVYGGPKSRLCDLVVPPQALIRSLGQYSKEADSQAPKLRLHGLYYIDKQIIPALERVFQLVGADVRSWFDSMPKRQRLPFWEARKRSTGATIPRFYLSQHCVLCDALTRTEDLFCQYCKASYSSAVAAVAQLQRDTERACCSLAQLCSTCEGCSTAPLVQSVKLTDMEDLDCDRLPPAAGSACEAIDCPVAYKRWELQRKRDAILALVTE